MAHRRHWPELLLVLLAAAVLSGRSRPPLPPQPDSWNLGGVSVGMTYSEVLRVLGLPIQIGEESSMVSDRVSYAQMRWNEDAPVKMAYFQEGRMVFCLGSSSSLFCGKKPIGVSQLGPGKESRWVTRTWWPAQNIGFTHDDEIVQVAPRYGEPTLSNDASSSTPWGATITTNGTLLTAWSWARG